MKIRSSLERPVKEQRDSYSSNDFTLLKQGRFRIKSELKKYADSGYQGFLKL